MAHTPNPSRRSWVSQPTPFLTPRPERRELRWAEAGSHSSVRRSGVGACSNNGGNVGDREANVQVVLRCRPLSVEEQKANVQSAVSCNDTKREVTVMNSLFKQADRTFTFDKVFGPKSQQRAIYDNAVAPIVDDVLEGYNCTVFAFGQTGTGKTYTMEGEMMQQVGDLPATAGVMPRAVRHIFEILEARKADYSMKVTFLELYNEEITDLLVSEDQSRFPEDRHKRPAISLMEDGKGGAVIRGLEKIVVYSPGEIYSLLEHGSTRRRTADTALNMQSSRSHSVFSIYIDVKVTTTGNQELMKCGRLNLVDLAGSESIARSGAKEVRAREAGELNKSLLTLGRVITALVEHSVHVPYRDSKLTRLLRESLGGKAKTCIIATVTPSVQCLEETLVTLDYAYRAKSIRNTPEVNQKVCKSVMLKDLYQEMEKMKKDVKAAREKNGIYIPHERFVLEEAEKKIMREKVEYMELSMEKQSKELEKYRSLYLEEQDHRLNLEGQNKELKMRIETYKREFLYLQEAHSRANMSMKEKDYIISNLLHAENVILERAKVLCGTVEAASGDIAGLQNKLGRQSKTEVENKVLLFNFRSQLDQSLGLLQNTVVGSICEQRQLLESMTGHMNSYFSAKSESANHLESRIAKAKDMCISGVQCMNELADTLRSITDSEQMELDISLQAIAVDNFLAVMVSEAEQVLTEVLRSTSELKELLAFSAEQQELGLQKSLTSAQAMSRTSIDFFNDISTHASRLMKLMEQSQRGCSSRLAEFEKRFEEVATREEQAALDKIAAILAGLTARKTTMVSEYVGQLNETNSEEQEQLALEISSLRQVSDNGKKEAASCAEKLESQFLEDMSSHANTKEKMGDILQQCLQGSHHSVSYWSHTQSCVEHLNKSSVVEANDYIQERRNENESIIQEIQLRSSHIDAGFHAITSDILTSSENSHSLDHETRKGMETLSTSFSNHLGLLTEKHNQGIESIRTVATNCIEKDYSVNSPVRHRPWELLASAYSFESIEELKASVPDLVAKFKSKNKLDEVGKGKSYLDQTIRAPRSPLTPVNHYN
ncbi:kinesin-like protein KIN-5B isoform X1 [Hordeum vulgare subsp. vulgare]|uniref:Kinesin motor domain-containing protein n=1 Tax=Hordeum vulgare subsp. vulgare TaxID=112509 RepID=A0A8I6X2T8_HORVV|nr:kinesin-like protein KIN-5B isoform X1 [Hordeum vulgare subsp. vulgare]